MTTQKNRIKAFEAIQTKPRTTRATGKAPTRRLESQFSRPDALFTQRLDKLAVKFKQSVPEFWEACKASRSIVNPPRGMPGSSTNVVTVPTTDLSRRRRNAGKRLRFIGTPASDLSV